MKIIVNQSKHKIEKSKIILGVLFLCIIIIVAINPAKYSNVAFKGIEIWAKILVPSLLPFFIITKLFYSTGITNGLTNIFSKTMNKLYKCPKESSYIFFMSILSGYPVGSKLIADSYNNGQLSKNDAIKTASFCSNSGPMFILGSVAIGMFANNIMGIVMLVSHIMGALLNGLLYRKLKYSEDKNSQSSELTTSEIDLTKSVNSSISSILLIGGVICFTFVILEIITTSNLFINLISLLTFNLINKNLLIAIFSGLGEITKGCLLLSSTALKTKTATLFCTFIISFGGISTFLQAMSFLKSIVPAKMFFLQKLTHAICSLVVCFLILLFIPI